MTVHTKAACHCAVARNSQGFKQLVLRYISPNTSAGRSMLILLRAEIPDSPTRSELRDYARAEFERHRNVTDLVGLH